MERLPIDAVERNAARIVALALFGYTWLQIACEQARAELLATVLAGPKRGHPLASRAAAQGLVEWSLAAAVLAFVGLAAWRLAGTAITDAVNRMIGNLNQAGA
jgi:hypothetical protein